LVALIYIHELSPGDDMEKVFESVLEGESAILELEGRIVRNGLG
jgi:hypothetical protein